MTTDHDRHAIDLTQLSSREQLSALMDSALPADQTRFLLRRLQHDASLAASWDRWRLAGEVMRGLAPAQRLPADFAARVAASLHGAQPLPEASAQARGHAPRWLQWGGGAAIAASLAVAALLLPRPGVDEAAGSPTLASAPAVLPAAPVPQAESPARSGPGIETLATAAAVAAVARPARERAAPRTRLAAVQPERVAQVEPAEAAPAALMPQPDIVTRPWPRSVLPQYADGGLTVGFGEAARGTGPYNPFQPQARFEASPAPAAAADGDVPATAQPPAQP